MCFASGSPAAATTSLIRSLLETLCGEALVVHAPAQVVERGRVELP